MDISVVFQAAAAIQVDGEGEDEEGGDEEGEDEQDRDWRPAVPVLRDGQTGEAQGYVGRKIWDFRGSGSQPFGFSRPLCAILPPIRTHIPAPPRPLTPGHRCPGRGSGHVAPGPCPSIPVLDLLQELEWNKPASSWLSLTSGSSMPFHMPSSPTTISALCPKPHNAAMLPCNAMQCSM